jgi:hypothetical protein
VEPRNALIYAAIGAAFLIALAIIIAEAVK